MASTEEVLKALQNAKIATLAAPEPEELVIDAETRTITVPSSERLFGVTGDMNIERKYFRCPKIVGDNVDLSTHQIFIAYVYTETESGSIFPSIGVAPYHCEDVEVDGEDITFSWKLTGNVFKNPGFILFKMYAKRTEADPNTVFNTTPAIGTVLSTIPDGTEEIVEEYPDVIAQIFDRLDALESGGGTGGTTNYENLSNKPQLNGVTLEGSKTLDQVGVLAKNQGSNNSGKFLSVGSDGNVVPADAPSGGTVDPEQIKQAVNGYLEENPVSGMTEEQEQQLNQNTADVADLKSALTSVTLGIEGDLLYIYINGEKVGTGIEISGNEEPIIPVVPTDIMSNFKYLGPTTYSPGTYTAWCPTGLIYDDEKDVYAHFMFVRGSHYSTPDQIELWFNTIKPDTLEHSEPIYVGNGSANVGSGGGFTGTCIKNGIYYAFSVAHGYYTSNNGGKSWTHNEYETAPSGVWGCYVLDNGRMIMGSDDGASVNYCSISDDDGKNWKKITVTGEFDEPTFMDFGKGSIMAIIRKQIASTDPLAKPFFRVSSDYGETWSEAVEMQTVGEMNANNCNAFIHDNYVELFVGCRIPSTNGDYTGTIYRINQYVLDRNKGPVDQFEYVNTVFEYKPDTGLEDFGVSTTSTDDFSTPCIAIKNKEQSLIMFYGPTRLGVTHQLIAVGNVPVDKYEIPSIIPKSYKTTQSFDGSNGSIVNICESYGIVNSNGYPNLQNGYLKIDDIRDGGFIHLGLISRGFGGNSATTFTVLTTANVINGKIKSGSYYAGLYRTPLPDDVDQLPRHPARKMAKSYENGEVLHLYAFIKNEEWWIYDDVGTWYRSSLGDCDIENVDFANNLDSFVIYPNNKEELTTYKTIGGLSAYQNIAIFEYDKQSA